MMPIGERVAKLEAEMATLLKTSEAQGQSLADIAAKQQEILLALTKNKGMWGGVVMTISAIITLFGMIKDNIAALIGKLFQ